VGFLATLGSLAFAVLVVGIKLAFPESAPRGITSLTLLLMLFGSVNLLGLGLLGEYLGKIIEETKQRPPFVRESLIRKGEVAPWRRQS
jgi:dolichol-phosphate mannosyltransferase